MKSILVVEDSPRSVALIKSVLSEHYRLVFAESTKLAQNILNKEVIDLILLDVTLPEQNGLDYYSEVATWLTRKGIPVIFLTSNEALAFKVSAFKLGASDYILKPFEPVDLKLRVEARLKPMSRNEISYITSELYIDHSQCVVREIVDGGAETTIDLSPTEYKLICFFVSNPEKIYSRNQIFDEVWGNQSHYLDRTIDKHISSLKKKIPELKLYLKTVYGMGYVFQSNLHSKKLNQAA